jgi:hypothetical protein
MVSNLNEYMNEKAQRKLNKQEKKFIKGKVHQWQEYEKNVKKGRLGFNRREQSQVTSQIIIDKCLEFKFDEAKYKEWISHQEKWDLFVAQNIEKKHTFVKKGSDSDEEVHPAQLMSQHYWSNKCRKCQ